MTAASGERYGRAEMAQDQMPVRRVPDRHPLRRAHDVRVMKAFLFRVTSTAPSSRAPGRMPVPSR